jgi:AIPR protein
MATKTHINEDGLSYEILETPGKAKFTEFYYSGSTDTGDGYTIHHAYIPCNHLKKVCLPLDANPREPVKGDVVKKMMDCLRDTPSNFHHWNNGITVICDNFLYDPSTKVIEVELSKGTGICNGGHTYFSISTMPNEISELAKVHIEFIKLPIDLDEDTKKSIINDIASKRNRNRALLQTTQADYLDLYDKFKDTLKDKVSCIKWHEGDSDAIEGAIGTELFIRLLACIDPFWFRHPQHNPAGAVHKTAATSSASIHSKWFDAAQNLDPKLNLYHLAPLCLRIMTLIDEISFSLRRNGDPFTELSPRWRGTSFYNWLNPNDNRKLEFLNPENMGAALTAPAQVMILGSFRSNVWLGLNEDGDPSYIGFLKDPTRLWNDTKIEYLRTLTGIFDDSGQDPNQFIKQNSPYDHQLIQLLYGRMAPVYPESFINNETAKEYVMDETNPTHYLSCDAGGFCDFDVIGNKSTTDSKPYKEI